MTSVTLLAVVDAMDMAGDEITAYINKKTGEIVTLSHEEISYADGDTTGCCASEWQEEMVEQAKKVLADDDWVGLPDQFDIDEYGIMGQYCASLEDQRVQEALFQAIRGKRGV